MDKTKQKKTRVTLSDDDILTIINALEVDIAVQSEYEEDGSEDGIRRDYEIIKKLTKAGLRVSDNPAIYSNNTL